jgi:hypothetical protein
MLDVLLLVLILISYFYDNISYQLSKENSFSCHILASLFEGALGGSYIAHLVLAHNFIRYIKKKKNQ